jgi:hypothetical protein
LWKQEEPTKPRILSVSNITSATALVTSSAFASPEGESHKNTRYQVQLAGGDWTSLVYDTGALGAVTSATVAGMAAFVAYQVRVAYADAEDDWSEWSSGYTFQTLDLPSTPGTFSWDDWAALWNIAKAYYYPGRYISQGGWWGPISWSRWDGVDNPKAGFEGHVAAMGRLFGPPATIVNTTLGPNNGVNVAGKVSWYSGQGGASWERWRDCEKAAAGVAALICGTCEPIDPSLAWNVWAPIGPNDWPCDSTMQGVVAYIRPRLYWPYAACVCCPPGSDSFADWVIRNMGAPAYCFFYGIDLDPVLTVEVWHNGKPQRTYNYDLPWFVTFNGLKSIWDCQGSGYQCRHFPKYGVRLKVWHDYATDPTGKTHRIQAAATTPPTVYHPPGGGINVSPEGYWGFGNASLPPEDGPWMIDVTWEGGAEETAPGEGDGGLYAGWTGFCANRATGVVPNNFSGGNIYLDFTATPLDLTHLDAPCTADTIPEGEIPPEDNPYPPSPAIAPCPPDVDSADKELYLGEKGAGAIYQFGGYEVAAGRQLIARIRPNPIAPEGYSGECLFKNIIVVVEHFSDIQIRIVPILNGERLDQYAQEDVFIGPGDRAALRRYEVPLYRAFEDAVFEGANDDRFKYGLRGAYLTFEMTIVDICGIGLQLPGVWIEYDPVRESQNTGIVYTEGLMRAPAFIPSGQVFLGTKGYNRLLKAASGVTDDGIQVEARVFTNPVSPAGAGGECHFKRASITIQRWNANDMDLKVTPYIDGEPKGVVTINYKATTAPVQSITEIDLAQYHRDSGASAVERFRYGLRGAWFHMKIETGSGLQEWLSFDGAEVEFDVVRESLQTDVR